MTYHLLNPAPIGEIIENNNKNKNKSKTKKKCTSYKDILNPKVDQAYSTIEGFDEDDEENIVNFNSKSSDMQYTNNNQKSQNIISDKETFNNINNNINNNNIYDSGQDNHYKSNYGNYDNNYTIDNSEFNKHINYSQGVQQVEQDINIPDVTNNKELLSKINYVIHLLEEQRSEKTNYITEELILYLFLGVFIIFVLDTFFKSSKYTR
jgi:hypothetical protein